MGFDISYLHRPARYYLDKCIVEVVLFFGSIWGFSQLWNLEIANISRMTLLYAFYGLIPLIIFVLLCIDASIFYYYYKNDISKALWEWNKASWQTDDYLSYDELLYIENEGGVIDKVGEELFLEYHEYNDVGALIDSVFEDEI